jgi:hypothetical protein
MNTSIRLWIIYLKLDWEGELTESALIMPITTKQRKKGIRFLIPYCSQTIAFMGKSNSIN